MSGKQLFANNATALLDQSISATSSTIRLTNGRGQLFPSPTNGEFFLITLENVDNPSITEIIKISARSGDLLMVEIDGRGQEGTTARDWPAIDTIIDLRDTAQTIFRSFEHSEMRGLDNDDHTQYVHNTESRTITAQHEFNPLTESPAFVLGANASGQLIEGLNADLLDGLSSEEFTRFLDKRLNVSRILTVSKDPGEGQFSSVAAALASIQDNSATSPYTITIAPGIYEEPQLQMKPYVDVRGSGSDATVLTCNVDAHFIIMSVNSTISDLRANGSMQPGNAIFYTNSGFGTTGTTSTVVRGIRFGYGHTLMYVTASGNDVNTVFVETSKIGGDFEFVQGFVSESSGSRARILIRNCSSVGTGATKPNVVIRASGAGGEIAFLASQFRVSTPAIPGNIGIELEDGALVRITGSTLRGFGTAIKVNNLGAPPTLIVTGAVTESNIEDIKIDHPFTNGSFNGTADKNKVFCVSDNFAMNYLDINGAGSILIGANLYLGPNHNTLSDVQSIIREAGAIGLLNGGLVVRSSAQPTLTINVNGGYGYVDTLDIQSVYVSWQFAQVELADNSTSFIYVDVNGQVLTSLVKPNTRTNILLAQVITNSGDITNIANIGFDATHAPNNIDEFLREALGSIFSSGCIVTEGTTPLTLDVSSGKYRYSTSTFTPAGGSPIEFYEVFNVGGITTSGTSTLSAVTNTSFDNGTQVQALGSTKYAKHTLFLVGDSTNETYFLRLSLGEYDTQLEAEQAPVAPAPAWAPATIVPIAEIVVRQGTSNIVSIFDIRPTLEFRAPSLATVSQHGNLLGLSNDDHQQYLLAASHRTIAPTFSQVLAWNGSEFVPQGGIGTGRTLHAWTGQIASSTGNTTIVINTAAPLSSEGTQIMAQTITPSSLDSKINLTAAMTVTTDTNKTRIAVLIFRGTTYIGATLVGCDANVPKNVAIDITDVPATLSPVTYSIRVACDSGNWYVNRRATENTFGGLHSSWTLKER